MEVKPTHLKTNVIKPKFSENTRISIISKTPYHFTNINEKCSHSPKKTFSSFILSKIRELLAFNCIKKSQKKQPEEIIEFDLIEKQLENNFTIRNNPEIINKNNEDLFNLIISPNQINQKPKEIEKNKFESTEQIKTNEFDSLSSDKKDYSFNHEYNEVENNDYNEISFQDEES